MYRLQYLLELLDLMTPHFDGYEYYEFDDFALPRGGSDLGLQGPTFSYAVGTLRTTQYQSVCYHINQKKKIRCVPMPLCELNASQCMSCVQARHAFHR
jgi:hypothetical protein